MRVLRRLVLAVPVALVVLPMFAGKRVSGVVFTEGKADKVIVRVVLGGLVVPMYSWQNPSRGEWGELPAGGTRMQLPVGSCTVQTIGPDGVMHEQQAVVPAQGEVTVRPEGP
jgi:hypothetical protein